MSEALLHVEQLSKYFPIRGGLLKRKTGDVKAVDQVSFTVNKGETFAIVGESGCGKSTTGRTLLRLMEPTGGKVLFEGKDVASLSRKELRVARRDMQMVFQDPFASLNPTMTVGQLLEEPMAINRMYDSIERKKKVAELMDTVGLNAGFVQRYPHEFSGGQRQRIGIARALSLKPKLIIADEPVSALDVSIQSQVLNLMEDLQEEFSLTYIFISHDLSVVKHIADRIGVMYLGRMAEIAPKKALYDKPAHPYTQALLSSVPIPNPRIKRERIVLTGDVPSPANPPAGCAFHPRCPKAFDRCKVERPELIHLEGGHYVACHLFDEEGSQQAAG
ncbi:ABC transporter ATP-binding protein [Desmospora profundinema]|uniref:Peptide/nickel transport system ATP-binding protein/oligopeptide transport system ATP-binding protein n=1 Tax=Desmospora profundinema TaxID=1571184 RepID=A0ABU1IS69_9BACL|nr:dipeptide ABC transporter ATP-binding protein [Desmospora profundinema]MDR6226600.1 peptide/nickel transport system ATP-binding protein/oligopeptide transport system ATP-binding protein [Desmospora profundinema]